MNRLQRYFLLPLAYAATAVSAVVVLGEPVEAKQPAAEVVEIQVEAAQQELRAAEAAARHAAHMRWLVTMPSTRKSNCCDHPGLSR